MTPRMRLTELNNLIGTAIQKAFPVAVWVVAEISEMKVNRSGHCYLELVEKDEATDELTARARGVIWSYTFRMVRSFFETTTGQPLSEGIKILVQVSVEFHPAYGLSLNIKDIDPTYTLGDLARKRKEIIRRLEEAGVFDLNRELPLPLVPQRIAVISSATAAGFQDFADQLSRNPYGFHFEYRLFEAFMQGSEAVPSILGALDAIFIEEKAFDAVAILRGGGSQADLSCFDSFDLAFAVAQFPLPVVTGIGHEKDETIVDLVAHTRQKTPTAVAEFFISGLLRFSERLKELERSVSAVTREILKTRDEELEEAAFRLREAFGRHTRMAESRLRRGGQRLHSGSSRLLHRERQELHRHRFRLAASAARITGEERHHTRQAERDLRYAVHRHLDREQTSLQHLSSQFRRRIKQKLAENSLMLDHAAQTARMLDPEEILRRGFTLTRQKGKTLRSAAAADPDLPITTIFTDGTTQSQIIKTTLYDNPESLLPGGNE